MRSLSTVSLSAKIGTAVCVLGILCAVSPSGFAKKLFESEPVFEKFPQLGSVHSLDVEFFTQSPGIEGQTPGGDLPATAVKRLRNNPVLPYKSPSDAILRFSCESFDCTTIKAQIVRRSDGAGANAPVIWEYRRSAFRWPEIPYYKLETTAIADKIIDKLLADVQSVKVVHEAPAENPKPQITPGRIEPVSYDQVTP